MTMQVATPNTLRPSDGAPPRVTWLLPVRNAMPYLTEALRSIAAQDYPRDRHAVLAWDNGSGDGSADELQEWIGPGRAIAGQVVAGQPMSLGRCLATMVEMAETELLARMDGDDAAMPDRLTRQVAFMTRRPRAGACGGGIERMDALGETIDELPAPQRRDADVRWQLRFNNPLVHPSVMMRRNAVLDAGNYHDLKPGQDYDLWIRLAERHELTNLDGPPLLRYREHDASVTDRTDGAVANVNRAIQQRHLDTLWPGLDEAMWNRLTTRMARPDHPDVRFADAWRLRRVATSAAERCGLPAGYFRRAERYRVQASSLWSRALQRQPGLREAWPTARRLRDRVRRAPITAVAGAGPA